MQSIAAHIRQTLLYGSPSERKQASAVCGWQPPLRVFLKMPYDVVTCTVPLQQCMRAMLSDLAKAWQNTSGTRGLLRELDRVQPMTCWLRAKTLGSTIMRSDEI